jgi:hypothetical protein
MMLMLQIAGGIVLAVLALGLIASVLRGIDGIGRSIAASIERDRSMSHWRRNREAAQAENVRLIGLSDEELFAVLLQHRTTGGFGRSSPTYSRANAIREYRSLLARNPEKAKDSYPEIYKAQLEADARYSRRLLAQRIGRSCRRIIRPFS